MSRFDEANEEFNNFMHKVTQVSNIVEKLVSKDKDVQEIGDLEAKVYLGENSGKDYNALDENNTNLRIRSNRTVINRKALMKNDNPSTQSQEAFMEEVSKDADMRYKDKLRRKERMETFRKQAMLAFKRMEYEKALSLYNKAIEQIKDNWLLYTNRALTYLNLKIYDKTVEDCKTALNLHENSLRARLLLAKAYYLSNDFVSFQQTIQEAKEINHEQLKTIDEFEQNLKTGRKE